MEALEFLMEWKKMCDCCGELCKGCPFEFEEEFSKAEEYSTCYIRKFTGTCL